ncbi:glycosyltransferase [Altericista sp. CCNU0014]|uniref:glycosyltransferase n=1 Tax=Altericista sp. CCNU0014 TaxID=3082949 RepID=UPI00384BDA96
MKALVISPQPVFSYRGTPLSVYYRTLMTAELGVEVDLLTYGEGQDIDLPGVRVIRIPRFKFLGNVPIGPSWLKLFLDLFIALWIVGLLLKNRHPERQYQFVHAHEEAVFICCLLKPLFKFKLIYDMHSSLPEQLVNFKFTTSKLLVGLFRALENASLHAADAVITVCPSLYRYTERIVGTRKRVFLIENSIFEEVRLKVPPHQDPPASYACPNRRSIVYAGTLEPYQGIDVLLRAIQCLVKVEPDAFLLVMGGTARQVERYAALAQQLGLQQRCQFTGRVAPATVRQCLRDAAVQVSCRVSGTNVPLKVYEQLANGIPLVATRIASHTQILDDEIAFLVEPEPQAMAAGIAAALRPDGEGARKAANAQAFYRQRYSRQIYRDKIEQVLDSLNVWRQDAVPSKRRKNSNQATISR